MTAFDELCALRWPDGVRCPSCGAGSPYRLDRRGCFNCSSPSCRKQFSPVTGTLFAYRKMPAAKYVQAIHAFPRHTRLADFHRELGVTYRTAFKLWHTLKATGGRLA